MYQKLYKSMRLGRIISLGLMAVWLSACQSIPNHDDGFGRGASGHGADHCHGDGCDAAEHAFDHNHSHNHGSNSSRARSNHDGLIVGAVVNANGRSSLSSSERWRYTDQLATHILQAKPELSGSIDSYEYLNRRVGAPLKGLLKNYRLQGDLSPQALQTLKSAQLRRRYLMLASILPNEQSFPLKPDLEPVIGQINRDVHDYYDLSQQTILLTAVRVQIYDTYNGSQVFDTVVRSDDGGRMLATESRSRKYVGNSLLASISNSIANGLNGSTVGAYPAPPKRDDVLAHIWGRVAQKLPGNIF